MNSLRCLPIYSLARAKQAIHANNPLSALAMPYGCARDIVGNEPFALLLPDVLVQSQTKSCLAQMMDIYNQHGGNIVAVEEVDASQTHNYACGADW